MTTPCPRRTPSSSFALGWIAGPSTENAAHEPERALRILADREGISPQAFANVAEHDIRMIAPADRAAYLAPNGQVAEAVRRSREILTAGQNSTRRVSSPIHRT
jgi:hypothetical protein